MPAQAGIPFAFPLLMNCFIIPPPPVNNYLWVVYGILTLDIAFWVFLGLILTQP